jgi:cell division protein FtsN
VARDYKNSKRGGSGGLPGIAGFVLGLAMGLVVAVGVYLFDRRPAARLAQEAPPMTRDEAPARAKPAPASAAQDAETQFEFYEMLPKFEVVIPEEREGAATPAAAPGPGTATGPVEKPGAYILQAGSFRNHADADRVRALIAMQGVESKIQKVTIDRDTWHRVRVGPITNLKQLDETRSKLRNARIDALVIKVGE